MTCFRADETAVATYSRPAPLHPIRSEQNLCPPAPFFGPAGGSLHTVIPYDQPVIRRRPPVVPAMMMFTRTPPPHLPFRRISPPLSLALWCPRSPSSQRWGGGALARPRCTLNGAFGRPPESTHPPPQRRRAPLPAAGGRGSASFAQKIMFCLKYRTPPVSAAVWVSIPPPISLASLALVAMGCSQWATGATPVRI